MTMLATTAPAHPSDRLPSPGTPAHAPETGARGVTTIAPRVIEKIAASAAARVPGAHTTAVSRLPSFFSPVLQPARSVDAEVTGATVRVEMHIEAEWPASIASVARRARDEVRAAVRDLVGLDLEAIDITVVRLVRAETRPRPRVR
jgi:uncharacterized alkaline shock family protein YloU